MCVSFNVLQGLALGDTKTIYPSGDGYVWSNPTGGDGSSSSFAVGNNSTSGIARSYIKFSLSSIPSGSTITSAKLYCYHIQTFGSGQTLTVYAFRADQTWSESTLTWPGGGWYGYYDYKSVTTTQNVWYSWNITSLVQAWFNGTYNNYGVALMLSPGTEGSISSFAFFGSREYTSSYRPYLYVQYTPPNQPPTFNLTGPSSNITVSQGDVVTITWTDSDPDDNASIALAYDTDCSEPGQTWITANLYEDPDGSGDQYQWDTTGVPTGTYRIWGFIYDTHNPNVFSCAPGSVTINQGEIISPPTGILGDQVVYTNTSHSYTASGASSNLGHSLEYRFNWGDGTYSSWGSATQSHSWSTAGSYYVDAQARCATHTDKVSTWPGINWHVTVLNPPQITVTSPNGGESWQAGNNYNITWSSTETVGPTVRIELYKDDSYFGYIVTSTANDGADTWPIPSDLPAGTTYQVKIIDTSNTSVYDYSDGYFYVIAAPQPPQLSNGYVTPSSGNTSTDFYYYVDYYDPDGDTPDVGQVTVYGDTTTWTWSMSLYSGSLSNGTYRAGPINNLEPGSHSYEFYFTDGNGGEDTLTGSGPTVESDVAEIISFTPPTGTLQRGTQTAATVRVKNTGTTTRSFWVGLSFADEVTFDLPYDTWPIGWYDVMPQQTETLSPGEESTVVFQFEIPLWLVPGLHKAATKVWDDYNRAQHLMLPYGQPFDGDTAIAFSLDVYASEPGTLIEQFIDMARSTETWRGIEGGVGSKYLQNEKMLIFLSVSTPHVSDFAGTILIDLPDLMGFTAEGYNDEWVTVWIDGSVSLGISLIPYVTAGVTGYEFANLNTADVRDTDYQTQVLSGNFFGTSITLLTVDSDGKLSWFETNRDFETNISGSAISGGMGLTRYEIKREYLITAFLNVVSPGMNEEEIFASLCELIDDIIENGTEGNEFRIPGTNDDGNWKPDTPTNLWPENGAMGVSTGPVLWGSPYHDQDGDLLLSGRFQIDDNSDFSSPVYDNENLDDTIELPEGFLNHNTQYYWRTCYQDNRGAWSNWSTPTTFTTLSSGVQEFILTTSVQGQGNVTLNPSGGVYDSGTQVELTANASSGWHFDHWEGDLSGSTNPKTITMNSNKSITAVFEQNAPIQYSLTASVIDGNGIISPTSGTYNAGTVVLLVATPDQNYRVKAWSGTNNDSSKSTGNTVTMNDNKNITVEFEQINPDLNGDNFVNFIDYAILASHLMENSSEPDWCDGADYYHDGQVGSSDLSYLCENWLTGTIPSDKIVVGDEAGNLFVVDLHTDTRTSINLNNLPIGRVEVLDTDSDGEKEILAVHRNDIMDKPAYCFGLSNLSEKWHTDVNCNLANGFDFYGYKIWSGDFDNDNNLELLLPFTVEDSYATTTYSIINGTDGSTQCTVTGINNAGCSVYLDPTDQRWKLAAGIAPNTSNHYYYKYDISNCPIVENCHNLSVNMWHRSSVGSSMIDGKPRIWGGWYSRRLYVLDANCQTLWNKSFGGTYEASGAYAGDIRADGIETILIGGTYNTNHVKLDAVNLANGNVIWTFDDTIYAHWSIHAVGFEDLTNDGIKDVVAASLNENPGSNRFPQYIALNGNDGALLWRITYPAGTKLSTSSVRFVDVDGDGAKEVLVIRDNTIEARSVSSGSLVKSYTFPANVLTFEVVY
jgi:hypothetical protein